MSFARAFPEQLFYAASFLTLLITCPDWIAVISPLPGIRYSSLLRLVLTLEYSPSSRITCEAVRTAFALLR
jgi:hypothetical protein